MRQYGAFDGKTGSPITFYMAVEIETNAENPDETIGLYYDDAQGKYFFRWVTGQPGYNDSHLPQGEVASTTRWAEGVLTSLKQFSPIVRLIDIVVQGDYGSLSGCSFVIHNTNSDGNPFWYKISIDPNYLINRNVKVYTVLNDVFYQVWGGVVAKTKYSETTFQFDCEDNYKNIHKAIPPAELNPESYPQIDPEFIGDVVPVSIGEVFKSKVMDVTGKSEVIFLGIVEGSSIDIAAATEYNTASDQYYLDIKTPNIDFPANYFRDSGEFFLRVIKGKEKQSLKITDNTITSGAGDDKITRMFLSNALAGVTVGEFNTNYDYDAGGAFISNDTWIFQVLKMDVYYLTSNKPISEYLVDSQNKLELTRYNSDSRQYDEISELLISATTDAVGLFPHPSVVIQNSDLDISGEFNRLIPIVAREVTFKDIYWNDRRMISAGESTEDFALHPGEYNDLDPTSGGTAVIKWLPASANDYVRVRFNVKMPPTPLEGFDRLFVVPYIDINTSGSDNVELSVIVKSFGPYGTKSYQTTSGGSYPVDFSDVTLNMLSEDYFRLGKNAASAPASSFGKAVAGSAIAELFEIDSSIISEFNDAKSIRNFEVQLEIKKVADGLDVTTFKVFEFGFVATQTINVIKEDIFVKIQGEKFGSENTNSVYNSFRHLLESYDGITSDNINYGNLSTTREDWRVGRQILERKSSADYLKELAQQSFVALYPTRKGKRGLVAFREQSDPVIEFNENENIIKDSITRFEKSSFSKMFNDFTLNYDWNPGLGKFNKTIRITNTDADEFPGYYVSTSESDPTRLFNGVALLEDRVTAYFVFPSGVSLWAQPGNAISYMGNDGGFYFAKITAVNVPSNIVYIEYPEGLPPGTYTSGTVYTHGSAVPKWTTYCAGIPDYVLAKRYWEVCNASYLQTLTVNPFKANLKWFQDNDNFSPGTGGVGNTAFRYLEGLIEWATRLKDITEFKIPITVQNIELELMAAASFSDKFYTDSETRVGWITKKKVLPGERAVGIELTLIPTDLEFIQNIIETGSGDYEVIESGSGDNEIIEGGGL